MWGGGGNKIYCQSNTDTLLGPETVVVPVSAIGLKDIRCLTKEPHQHLHYHECFVA